jgi:hypothetical protein
MAEARERAEWARASCVIAMVHNVQCAKKADMKEPGHFNPWPPPEGAARAKPVQKVSPRIFKGMLPRSR